MYLCCFFFRQPNRTQVRGSTVGALAILPAANRIDPQLLPPPISEDDAQKGILSLIERGLIPPAADLTLDPSPVHHRTAKLHNPTNKEKKILMPGGLILDKYSYLSVNILFASQKLLFSLGIKWTSNRTVHSKGIQITQCCLQPPPTTPASAPDFKERCHRFAIQHGRTRETSQEFMAFKQHYCLSWGSIISILRHMERMLTNYAVPIAFVNGDKLADLSLEFELERPPTNADLLSVIVNREDVETLINRPGRRYVGHSGRDEAAKKIQATFRMYHDRSKYLEYRRKKWASGVIALSWLMHIKLARVRKQLRQSRLDLLETHKRRTKYLARNWERISHSPRVIIHIPSCGHSRHLRQSMKDFNIYQNLQMARLCDIKDPNVDVIYVSPVPVNDEMTQYYTKLLGLRDAIDTGEVDDQSDISMRYKIIHPDSARCFPSHNMCLATLLKHSPRTLKRIKNLIRGREAYIVTGMPQDDDLYVADALDVPVLCPEPDIAQLYSTKSGSKRIFASAGVTVPPGEYDVYSLPQLQETLALLITENLEVSRWIFKLDDQFDGRGIAYVDVQEHLPCYKWATREAQRYGEKWNKKWAQEAAYIKIHQEILEVLTQHAQPINKESYQDWNTFLHAFLCQGGIIEACPPSDSVTALTVNMLIEPTGKIKVLMNGDQIHAETQFAFWGLSLPQSSVEPDALNEACERVGRACSARGIMGYFTVDFVTFIHPKTMKQELWAVDLTLKYSDSLAMFSFTTFATGGHFDPLTHTFDIPPLKREEKKSRRKRIAPVTEEPPNTNRFAVMSARLMHTNLSVVHYSVFFQMCRAHGIGYDVKEKQGTLFTLVDSQNRENLGMLTIGETLQGALGTFARNLSVIHQEISAPNMQGSSNFRPVIEDIESILGITIQNTEDGEDLPEKDME
ncbi:hypothetical protein CAPTEDRAFT_178180 [Capitella teleta]|uniref:IQCH-like ATP-grasp domain-containing protein n=1 Tax=Capitella teleta TaxID=283909 RepID=R7TVD8_CAPTE|nr:hypothetical protein CAPTEDRAFT_178180 [Capitella teleta]|eukprot:ELT97689.1 hypothetical protein CAPTEDRAFT_178180 [Capitella teleta]